MGQASESTGSYESPVHDSNTVARWGRLSWRAQAPSGSKLVFRTRTGNSARPDNTWSDWSAPVKDLVTSPNARYIQWKAEFNGSASAVPTLDSVTVAYLPQNTPPVVRSVNVTTAAAGAKASAAAAGASATSAYSVTVSDTGEASTAAGNPTQTLSRGPSQQTQITWQADDPDGDRLSYTIYFRGEEEQEWKLLRANFFENSLTLEADVLGRRPLLFPGSGE